MLPTASRSPTHQQSKESKPMAELTPQQVKIGQKLKALYEKGKKMLADKAKEPKEEQPIS